MTTYYIAATYDVCEHHHLFEEMNRYPLDLTKGFEEQIKVFAKRDIAPVVKVFASENPDYMNARLYEEFTFAEYRCNCNE